MNLNTDTLNFLYEITCEHTEDFDRQMNELIENPTLIAHTDQFAALLVFLNREAYISSLLRTINNSEIGDVWLLDFLYAAGDVVERASMFTELEMPEGFTQKLGNWLLGYQGEISWKTAVILQNCYSSGAEQYMLQKLKMKDAFVVHTTCLTGLMNLDAQKNIAVVKQMANDDMTHQRVKAHCEDIIALFNERYPPAGQSEEEKG